MSGHAYAALLYRHVSGPGRTGLTTVLVVAPLLGLVTAVANAVDALSILLFPPLAAATYELFTRAEEHGPVPWDVPIALSVGALGGWAAITLVDTVVGGVPPGPYIVHPLVVVFALLFTGVPLWALSIEIPPAFAVGLLLPFAGVPPATYLGNVAAASTLVALAFTVWQRLS